MNKIVPIINLIVCIIATILAVFGIIFSALSAAVSTFFGLYGVTITVISLTLAAVGTMTGFLLGKSKLCRVSAIISLIALCISIASLVVLIS